MQKYLWVLVPLILGVFIYQFAGEISWLRNYLPDGLWAFSFGYAFLLLWQPRPKSFLHLVPLLFLVGFEFLQYLEIITGTFDLIDCLIYILFYLSASIVFYYHEQKTAS